MAIKQNNHVSFKMDDNLQARLNAYIEKYGADKSKVTKLALDKYLAGFDLPIRKMTTKSAK